VFGVRKEQWLLAAFSGLLQVLIFPSPSLYLFSWVALVPLLGAVLLVDKGLKEKRFSGPSLFQGFVLGYLSGIFWYAGSCYWVFHAMHSYGGLGFGAAVGVLILFCLYLALYHGLFGILLVVTGRRSLRAALLLSPFLWVAVELARTRVTGFPWNLLGTAQVDNIPLTRVAEFTGVYGLSFVIVLVNGSFVAALMTAGPRRWRLFGISLVMAGLLQAGVLERLLALPAEHTALLVQHNLPLAGSWTQSSLYGAVAELAQMSSIPASEAKANPRLIIWPESPAPFFESDPGFRQAVSVLAREQNAYVLAALVGEVMPAQGGATPALTNRAALITPDGSWPGHYDKIHLVPFGEYVPFQPLFSFAGGLTREVGNYTPGKVRTLFDVEGGKFGAFICYESVFPDEVRQFAATGAQVLVNVSDDGWYGHYGAPGQHLNMARMRAIENRRWLLRATNNGITASIDPLGRVVAQAPADQRTTLTAPYGFISATTFYTRHGDLFAWACVIIASSGLLLQFLPK